MRQRVMDSVWRRVRQLAPTEADSAKIDSEVKRLLLKLKGPSSKEAVMARLTVIAKEFSFIEDTETLADFTTKLEEELDFIVETPEFRPAENKLVDLFKSRLSSELRNLVDIRKEKDADFDAITLIADAATLDLGHYRQTFPNSHFKKNKKNI